MLRSVFLFMGVCAHIASTLAFATLASPHRAAMPLVMRQSKENESFLNYNDDAFGLVFLGSFAVEHDNIFAGTFGILSAVAAILVRKKVLEYRPLMPGIVAVGTVLALTAVTPSELHPNRVTLLQLGTCAISLGWSIVQEIQQQDTKG
jgi:hypothetical protein